MAPLVPITTTKYPGDTPAREKMMESKELSARLATLGLRIPGVMLPNNEVDLRKWSVIACDQFTADSEYWDSVERTVGESPSTLRLILPERYLRSSDVKARTDAILASMNDYLVRGIVRESGTGFVLVRRGLPDGRVRTGLLAAVDLEQYDYRPGAISLVRATEGTIADRIPPRTNVRRGAPIELSHVLVLYDDPDSVVMDEILKREERLTRLYDFDLMLNSGRLTGDLIGDEETTGAVVAKFQDLADPARFARRLHSDRVLLFAVGDGNHSLAAAKAVWEETKKKQKLLSSSEHPGRHALVELVNIHDPGLRFEPIHRVVFGGGLSALDSIGNLPGANVESVESSEIMMHMIAEHSSDQRVGVATSEGFAVIRFNSPLSNVPVGTLQPVLDKFLADHPNSSIDYIHGNEAALRLGRVNENAAFFLPAISKDDFFPTIVRDGCFPRKTFSMGEAEEKRFYVEARRIV